MNPQKIKKEGFTIERRQTESLGIILAEYTSGPNKICNAGFKKRI
jgi:hypothetical protein